MNIRRWFARASISLAGVMLAVSAFAQQAAPTPAATPAPAQVAQAESPVQPGNNAPTWRKVNGGEAGFSTLPAREAGVLILREGDVWRQLRNGPLTLYGGVLLVAMLLVIGAFYQYRGRIDLTVPKTGKLVERFGKIERTAHWLLAGSFVLLALTGLMMLFGKHLLLPVLGHTLFGYLTIVGKNIHNFVGPVFAFAVFWVFVLFARDNIPSPRDWLWLRKFGGLFTGEHVPSGRFNAGEKTLFWLGVVLLGVFLSVTGFVLDFPNFAQLRTTMQTMHLIHATAAVLFVAMIVGHIYIGSIGMEGALDSMKTGYVDEAWAREHHEDWYNELKSGKGPV